MLCFRFNVISSMNYLQLDNNIKNNYKELYEVIIKSDIMEKIMKIDNESSLFEYPYKNEKILKEVENNCLFVPFPAEKYYGYTDKVSFTIYLNSLIDISNVKDTIVDIDNITKTKNHEFETQIT